MTDRNKTSPTSIRRRATGQALLMAGLAVFLWWRFNLRTPALILLAIGGFNLMCGWFIPSWFNALDQVVQSLARWLGTLMTWILLIPFFYLFFGLARLCLLLRGKDPMFRRWDKTLTSYWADRPPVTETAHYTRQY